MIKFLYKLQVPQTQANTTICENHVEMMRDEIKGNSQEVQSMVCEREGKGPVGRADAGGIIKTREEDDLDEISTTKNSASLKCHNYIFC